MDSTQKEIQRHIGWLNRKGVLGKPISCTDVIDSLYGVGDYDAAEILNSVEKNAENIANPTKYILNATANILAGGRQNGGGGYGGGGIRDGVYYRSPAVRAHNSNAQDPTGKIARQVGWLNKNAGLADVISFKDVVGPLTQLVVGDAMMILKDLEQGASKVKNPTAYVVAAANRQNPCGSKVAAPEWDHVINEEDLDPTGKISRQVGWLNKHAELSSKISFSDVVAPLSELEVPIAMAILKELQEAGISVTNPTNYVVAAASRMAKTNSFHMAFPKRPYEVANHAPHSEDGKKISRQIGWLNTHIELADQISYVEVAEVLAAIDVKTAMQILKDVEINAASIQNPTGYVAAAARRNALGAGPGVRSGDAPKRARLANSTRKTNGNSSPRLSSGNCPGLMNDEEKKLLSRQVGQMNSTCDFAERISYSDVKESLESLTLPEALNILQDVVAAVQRQNVAHPTQYIITAVLRLMTGETNKPSEKKQQRWSPKQKPDSLPDKIDQSLDELVGN